MRTVDGEKIEYRVRLNDLINKGEIKHNVDINPGDIIIIPETLF